MITNKAKQIKRELDKASSYEEWKALAIAHDQQSGMQHWREREESKIYDYAEIRHRLDVIRSFREKKDDQGLLFTLNEGIHGNMGGMGNPKLYAKSLFGTKTLIEEYIDEVADALMHLSRSKNRRISKADKIDFFHRASHCFGRSALILSGGGQLGNFHIGVLKALSRYHLLPSVIAGSSAGALFAALVGTRTDQELDDLFAHKTFASEVEKEAIIYQKLVGDEDENVVKAQDVQVVINNMIPDLTFQEAFELTGRKINISIAPYEAHQRSRLLNSVASPSVLIRSAVMASCAIPGIFPPVTLMAKNHKGEVQPYLPSRKWVDGSMSNDIPTKRLARLFGVNHFIVSLTNPLVLPFITDPTKDNEFFQPVRRLSSVLLKETTQFNYSLAKRFFRFMPSSITFAANTINSIVQQEYIGDINIIADQGLLRPGKLLAALSPEELLALIRKGEKTTWPKLEAIRITTKIGRVLDEILAKY